jgi:hypothetical protein
VSRVLAQVPEPTTARKSFELERHRIDCGQLPNQTLEGCRQRSLDDDLLFDLQDKFVKVHLPFSIVTLALVFVSAAAGWTPPGYVT